MMMAKTFYTLWAISAAVSAAVFVERDEAHVVLVRSRRANSGYFEELKQGNLERECREEICNYEEAHEVFENDVQTETFWLTYQRRDPCLINPCKNNGTCITTENSYMCMCPEGFEGKHCQSVFEDTLKCLYLNGGCEHFCNSSGPQRKCSCAPGYALGEDERKCVAKVQYPCGKIPSLDARINETQRYNAQVRLVGGNHCPRGHCPWQVLLVHNGTSLCGGVIVHPEWVITAAHCVLSRKTKDLLVVAGEHNIDVVEDTEQWVSVADVIPYGRYEPSTGDGDIALLRLRKPLALGPDVVPVCLPQQQFANTEMAAVRFHAVSGWGKRTSGGNAPQTGAAHSSPVLRKLAVPLISNPECSLKSGFNVTQNMLCAGYFSGSHEACRGDDGSPLVTHYSHTYFLMGVVAWGKGCPRMGSYGVYTNMANFLDWAEEVMKTAVANKPVPVDSASLMPFQLESALDDFQTPQASGKTLPEPLLS